MFPTRPTPKMRGLSGLYRGPTGVGQFFAPRGSVSVATGIPVPVLTLTANKASLTRALLAIGADGAFTATLNGSPASGSSYGLEVNAGTTSADFAAIIKNQTGATRYLQIFGDGHGTIGPSATLGLSWNTAGAMIVAAPTAGAGLTVNAIANNYAGSFAGASSQYAVNIVAPNSVGVSLGLTVFAGTNVSDKAVQIVGADATRVFMLLRGDGSGTLGYNGTTSIISFLGTGSVSISAPSSSAALQLPAGTTAVYPLLLTSGTNLTTPVAGGVEYDGTTPYFTPFATCRGVSRTEFLQAISAAYTLTSQTAAQKLLNATANGAITLPIGVYEFECCFSLTALSATSGSFGFALGGTATITQAWWALADKAVLATAAAPQMTFDTAANTSLATASLATTGYAWIRGVIRVTVAGTVIPQVSLTIAAAAVVGANSFFLIQPIGPSGFTTVGQWT